MKAKPCNRCGRPIVFVRLVTGTPMPCEPIPDPEGTVCARRGEGGLAGWVESRERPYEPGMRRYMPHAALCPVRPRFARKRLPDRTSEET